MLPILLIIFLALPFVIGLIFLKRWGIMTFICGMVIVIFTVILLQNPYIEIGSSYSDGTWHTLTQQIPFHPELELILIVFGFGYMALSVLSSRSE